MPPLSITWTKGMMAAHVKQVISFVAFFQRDFLAETRDWRVACQCSSIPSISPRVEQPEVVPTLFETKDVFGRKHFRGVSSVGGQHLVSIF